MCKGAGRIIGCRRLFRTAVASPIEIPRTVFSGKLPTDKGIGGIGIVTDGKAALIVEPNGAGNLVAMHDMAGLRRTGQGEPLRPQILIQLSKVRSKAVDQDGVRVQNGAPERTVGQIKGRGPFLIVARKAAIGGTEMDVVFQYRLDALKAITMRRYHRGHCEIIVVPLMVNCLVTATTPARSHEIDPFWTRAETALLQALAFYLFYEAPEYEQNFSQVCRMLSFAEARENDEEYMSALDMLFEALEREEGPEHIAVKQYKVYRQAKGKTASSILVSLAVRLAPFNIPQIQRITGEDEMDLWSLGEEKAALFAVIPDNHATFNFLVSLLYQQAFMCLYYSADQIHHGRLPRHVRFILDEFASVKLEGYTRELATMRSRNISACTVIQNMAQIKEIYKDSWETIPGNSDTILYLGGNEQETHKYISTALGKASIQTKTHGQTHGSRGSYSTNTQITGRELLTPDEVRLLDNRCAILLIRGARPCMDEKYPLMSHPNISYAIMSGAPPYLHKKHLYYGRPFLVPETIPTTETEKENPHENE